MAELLGLNDLNELLATMIGMSADLHESITAWGIDPKAFGDFIFKIAQLAEETGLDDGFDPTRTRMNNLILGFIFGMRVAHEIALREDANS